MIILKTYVFGTRNQLKLLSKLHNQWFDHFRPRSLFIMDILAEKLNLPIEKKIQPLKTQGDHALFSTVGIFEEN